MNKTAEMKKAKININENDNEAELELSEGNTRNYQGSRRRHQTRRGHTLAEVKKEL
jgi:hypothetical protein